MDIIEDRSREDLLKELASLREACREADDRALQAEKFWQDTFDAFPDMVTIHDKRFNIVLANKAAEQILDLPALNVKRAQCYKYYHGTEAPPTGCPSCQCLQSGAPASFEIFEPHLRRHLEIRATPIFNGTGEVSGLIHIVKDISEKKKADEKVLGLLRELNTIFDNLPLGVAYLDADLRFLKANRALSEMSGLGEEALIGRHCYETIGEYADDHARSGLEKMCSFCKKEECTLVKGPTVIERPLGDSIIRVTTVPELDEKGDIVNFLEIFEDITDQKEAEDRLRKAMAELERSNKDLEQFAYVASHDLREPLRVVVGFVQLLAKRYRGKIDKDADEYIDFAVSGATRMDDLINDLLAYSRVGAEAPMRMLHSGMALERAVANLRKTAEDTGAEVTYDPLPVVFCNEMRLTQLFQNLIGNAIKFRGEAPPRIHVSALRGTGEWVFSVSDNGIGIPAGQKDRIFEVFQRLHGRGKYPGTGIGLAICKKIVERRGGRIRVESEPGKGSTFYFSIPDGAPGGPTGNGPDRPEEKR
jgi:PAS domain S-box-containing protein